MLSISAIQHLFKSVLMVVSRDSFNQIQFRILGELLEKHFIFIILIVDTKCYLSHEFSEFFRRQKVSDVMAACCGLRQLKSLVGGLLHLGLAGFVFPGATLF
jgi:hypothetical protein